VQTLFLILKMKYHENNRKKHMKKTFLLITAFLALIGAACESVMHQPG